jgi:hypothetical protein
MRARCARMRWWMGGSPAIHLPESPRENVTKRFLAIYTGSAEAMARWNSMPERELRERRAAGIKAWHEWVDRNRASVVDPGAPLGPRKRVSPAGVNDIRNSMGAFTVVQAQSRRGGRQDFRGSPALHGLPW